MTEMQCGYIGDREAALIAYLYDDIDAVERAAFDAHLVGCVQCRAEVAAMAGVRQHLAAWNPPSVPAIAQASSASSSGLAWWRAMPAWAQVAAALLFLGISASVANLDVRYDANGLAVRTGWLPAAPAAASVQPAATATRGVPMADVAAGLPLRDRDGFASKTDLAALEQRLRSEMHSEPVSARAADPDLLRKVRALVEESEKRQQRELALRLAQAMTDISAQRQADLRKIDTTLTGVERDLGIQVLQQRERMNYLMRVNQRQ
jgi:hypothetical protein